MPSSMQAPNFTRRASDQNNLVSAGTSPITQERPSININNMLDSFFSSANQIELQNPPRLDEFPDLLDLPEERERTNFLYSAGRS